MLYVFENNEAVNKMIIKGRSPTTRHVSRTHRVAFDWLFVRINLDSAIQMRHIDTKHQLADILPKGDFTCDEWNNLLQMLNITHFTSICFAKSSSLINCTKTMAKRMQEDEGEEISVAKSRSSALNLSSHALTSSSSAKSLIAPKSPGILIATWKLKQDEVQNPTQRRVQARLQDAYLGGLMDKATEKPVATK